MDIERQNFLAEVEQEQKQKTRIKLETKKKYRVTTIKGETPFFMEFIPMTIDRENDELYIKVTSPISCHQAITLSSMEENKKTTIEEIPM